MFPRKVALPFFDQLFQVGLMFGSQLRRPVKSTGTPTLRISTNRLEKVDQKKETGQLFSVLSFIINLENSEN